MRTTLIFLAIWILMLVGCQSVETKEITSEFSQISILSKGYKLGAQYVLQEDLFVTESDWPDYYFMKPGDGVPTAEQWRAGVRKPQFFRVTALLPAGTRLRVEKIVYLKAIGSGVSHATGMLKAEGVELLIRPFSVSNFLSGPPYGTVCIPDDRFLREVVP